MSSKSWFWGEPGDALFVGILSVGMFFTLMPPLFPVFWWPLLLLDGLVFVLSAVFLSYHIWQRHKNGCADRWGWWQAQKSLVALLTISSAALFFCRLWEGVALNYLWFYIFMFFLSLVFLVSRLWYDHRRKKKRASETIRSDD